MLHQSFGIRVVMPMAVTGTSDASAYGQGRWHAGDSTCRWQFLPLALGQAPFLWSLVLSPLRPLLLALLITTPALASEYSVGSLTLVNPWTRATPPIAQVAGGYVTIVNSGNQSDRLLTVTSPIAERIEIHESTIVDGVARMRPVAELVIARGETVALKPGGLHLMLLKPSRQLRQGERIPGTFVFEKAGVVSVEFVVQGMGASAAPHADHGPPRQ